VKFQQVHPEVKVLVARDSRVPEIRKLFRSQGISEKIILATDGDVAKFGTNGVPQTNMVDENGRIRLLHYGGLPDVGSYLEADLSALKAHPAIQ
jgi:hypothetical protein